MRNLVSTIRQALLKCSIPVYCWTAVSELFPIPLWEMTLPTRVQYFCAVYFAFRLTDYSFQKSLKWAYFPIPFSIRLCNTFIIQFYFFVTFHIPSWGFLFLNLKTKFKCIKAFFSAVKSYGPNAQCHIPTITVLYRTVFTAFKITLYVSHFNFTL